ncbi:hypothetical protein TNCV_4315771 [Trichonephila clavipes]|nr:hypothetical protein TNCV_4315771 [Trichonephila clavipes]
MESLSGQSFVPTNLGRVDEEMIPPARGVSQSDEDDTCNSSSLSKLPHHANGKTLSLDRFNVHEPLQRVVSGIPMTRQR